MLSTTTRYWHTWVDGYRACVKGIPRDHNWFEKVRPGTTDSLEWFAGWDKAASDLGIKIYTPEQLFKALSKPFPLMKPLKV